MLSENFSRLGIAENSHDALNNSIATSGDFFIIISYPNRMIYA